MANDEVKDWIAAETAAAAKFFERRGIPSQDGSPHEVTVHEVSKLVTQVRVKTQHQGVRYFTIKVSEAY